MIIVERLFSDESIKDESRMDEMKALLFDFIGFIFDGETLLYGMKIVFWDSICGISIDLSASIVNRCC